MSGHGEIRGKMPHIVVEYSSNIKETVNASLLASLHHILVTTASATLASCKSRAVERSLFYVGNGEMRNAFVHIEVRLAEGRTAAIREKVGEQMLQVLNDYFVDSLEELNMQITVEVQEFPKQFYFKIPSGTV